MKITEININDIHPYENNPRINDDAVDAVAASIQEFGWKQPIVVDEQNTIIAGHTRHKAALKLGLTAIPCVVASDLTDEQILAYRLADNKTADLAEWDTDLLSEELEKILEIDMGRFGFVDEADLVNELTDGGRVMDANIPQYEITGDCPELSDLLDTDKSNELISEIEAAEGVTSEEKDFLKYAAYRHNVFNYRNVAEYYAHAAPEMQRLMEKSALVIIDVNDAIMYGYAELMAGVLSDMEGAE